MRATDSAAENGLLQLFQNEQQYQTFTCSSSTKADQGDSIYSSRSRLRCLKAFNASCYRNAPCSAHKVYL